ncbi:MAG: formyl transferase [Planctomycetaceae bacterium]|nr:formyl transferase [Planctomycetaceae bacterium]MCP4480455.1 formyl transferase [Planctomycetaceae bacterium]
MNKIGDGNILFLGDKNSPLLRWLIGTGESVIQTTETIESSFIPNNKVSFLISYGYRHIIRKNILDQLPNRAINLHISLLPWNKGADPNLWSFVDGTPKGVTIHYLDPGIDTGDIIVQQEVEFDSHNDTLETTYQKLQCVIQALFQKNWQSIKTQACSRRKQEGQGSTHKSIDKEALSHLLVKEWDTPISTLRANIENLTSATQLDTNQVRGKDK